MMSTKQFYLLSDYLKKGAMFYKDELINLRERHKIEILPVKEEKIDNWHDIIKNSMFDGVVIKMDSCMPSKLHLKAAKKIIKRGGENMVLLVARTSS